MALVEQSVPTAAQQIAGALREQILSGSIAPNTRVTQRDLAARFGHSPMPARDAVKILLAEGLVVQEGSKTIVVAPLRLADFVEIMTIRELLEPHMLELAIPNMTADDMAAAKAALELPETAGDHRQITENHWLFHQIIYRPARRPRLLALIEQQHLLLVRHLLPNWGMHGVLDDWASDEAELIALIEQRQVEEAVAWLRRDLRAASDRVMRQARQ
jgi:DNA-binding GntR family transcriptional regulator